MNQTIFQKSVQDQFNHLNDSEKAGYMRTHWIHKDGHITTKHKLGNFLNKWVVTRLLFRKIFGIGLPDTIQRLKQSKTQLSEREKQEEFNSTCDVLISMIQHTHSKQNTTFINDLKNLKFTWIATTSLTPEAIAKITLKVKDMKSADAVQVRQKMEEILKEHAPEHKEAVIAEALKHAHPDIAVHIFQEEFSLPPEQAAAEKAAKVAGVAQNAEAFKKVLANDTLQETVAGGLEKLNQTNHAQATSIAQQVAQTIPTDKITKPKLASILKTFEDKEPLSHEKVEKIIQQVHQINITKTSEVFLGVDKILNDADAKTPEEQERVIKVMLQNAKPEVAIQLLQTHYDLSGAKLEGLVENKAALKAVLADRSLDEHVISGIDQIKRKSASQGDLIAEQIKQALPSGYYVSKEFEDTLNLRGEIGQVAAKVKAFSEMSDPKDLKEEIKNILQPVSPENQSAYLQVILGNIDSRLMEHLLRENFTQDPQAEILTKLTSLSEMLEGRFLYETISRVHEEAVHTQIANALTSLEKTDRESAVKLAKLIAPPSAYGKLHLSLQNVCEDLNPLSEQTFAQKIKQLNTQDFSIIEKAFQDEIAKFRKYDQEYMNTIMQTLSVVSPEGAAKLCQKIPTLTPNLRQAFLALHSNPPALQAVLEEPLCHNFIYKGLYGVYVEGCRKPLRQRILNKTFEEMEQLGVLKSFVQTPQLNLGPLIKDAPLELQKLFLSELKEDSLPHIVSQIVYRHSVPIWQHDEEWLVDGPYGIEDFDYRPVEKNELSPALFDKPESVQALNALQTTEQKVQCILHFADELNEIRNPAFCDSKDIKQGTGQFVPGTEWDARERKQLNQIMEKRVFLTDQYSNIVKEEYREGLEELSTHLLTLVNKLSTTSDFKPAVIKGIKENQNIESNIFLLLLLLKLDPTEYKFVTRACHDHEFSYLLLQMPTEQQEQFVQERIDLFKGIPNRLNEFKEIFMAFIPASQVSNHKRWATFFDQIKSK